MRIQIHYCNIDRLFYIYLYHGIIEIDKIGHQKTRPISKEITEHYERYF